MINLETIQDLQDFQDTNFQSPGNNLELIDLYAKEQTKNETLKEKN